jgi:hypothetical protein
MNILVLVQQNLLPIYCFYAATTIMALEGVHG